MEEPKTPVERAIKTAGSEAKLAAKIGFSQVAVNKAKRRGSCSPRMALAIERAFDGEFSKEQLCPAIFEGAQ